MSSENLITPVQLESAGSTISLTLAGIILDGKIFKHPKETLDLSPKLSLRELAPTDPSPQSAIERLLLVFAFLNFLHLTCTWFLWKLDISKRGPNGYQILSGDTALRYESGEREENDPERDVERDHHLRHISSESINVPLSHNPPADRIYSTSSIPTGLRGDGEFVVTEAEIARGKILFRISIALIVATWMFYSITLLMDLVERQGGD
jgi:hypothetical protein